MNDLIYWGARRPSLQALCCVPQALHCVRAMEPPVAEQAPIVLGEIKVQDARIVEEAVRARGGRHCVRRDRSRARLNSAAAPQRARARLVEYNGITATTSQRHWHAVIQTVECKGRCSNSHHRQESVEVE